MLLEGIQYERTPVPCEHRQAGCRQRFTKAPIIAKSMLREKLEGYSCIFLYAFGFCSVCGTGFIASNIYCLCVEDLFGSQCMFRCFGVFTLLVFNP